MEIKTGDDYVLYCIMWCDIMGGQIIFINRSGGRVPLVPPWDLHLWLSACTVAKKMLLVKCQPLHILSMKQWNYSLIEILSVALMNGAGHVMLEAKKEAIYPDRITV